MVKKRIIPCLDLKGGQVVKGIGFDHVIPVADPFELARRYNDGGADELVIYDISAHQEDRTIGERLLLKMSRTLSIPLTVGGGIGHMDHIKRAFASGADKVSINSGALKNPGLIAAAAAYYGNQSIALSVDIKRVAYTGNPDLDYAIYTNGGKDRAKLTMGALEWIRTCVREGAGEVVVNSIDDDGMKKGYNLPLLQAICRAVNVPVVASGGAGCQEHFEAVFRDTHVSGALAASVFHYNILSIQDLKAMLIRKGVPIRCQT